MHMNKQQTVKCYFKVKLFQIKKKYKRLNFVDYVIIIMYFRYLVLSISLILTIYVWIIRLFFFSKYLSLMCFHICAFIHFCFVFILLLFGLARQILYTCSHTKKSSKKIGKQIFYLFTCDCSVTLTAYAWGGDEFNSRPKLCHRTLKVVL